MIIIEYSCGSVIPTTYYVTLYRRSRTAGVHPPARAPTGTSTASRRPCGPVRTPTAWAGRPSGWSSAAASRSSAPTSAKSTPRTGRPQQANPPPRPMIGQ
eukprot:scaffold429452_cov32-Prasinocladus_malaysianus.AAC.1